MTPTGLTIDDKLEKFAERMADELTNQPVVFCLNCGSINIDQNSVSQLKCYDCREISLWNGRKFGIARGGDSSDVRKALTPVPDWYWDNWNSKTVEALYDFGRVLSQMESIGVEERAVASKDLRASQYEELREAWEIAKTKIDNLLL